jgi:virginiamycin B lyase
VGVTVAPDGDVWFTEMSGDEIGRFDPGTLRFTAYPVPTPDATPYWLALAPDGRVWFTEFGAGKVGVLDPPTGRIREYALPGGPNPPGIAVGSDGTVWITSIQGSLFRLTPSSGRIRRTVLPGAGDYGVALAPDGTVWVGRQGGAALYAVDAASGRVRAHRVAPGSAPWWPVVDRRGHVWVALASDTGNGLAELDVPP